MVECGESGGSGVAIYRRKEGESEVWRRKKREKVEKEVVVTGEGTSGSQKRLWK